MKTSYVFTEHARFEMKRRALSEAIVVGVIENPEQQWEVRNGRSVMQSRISMYGTEKQYLVRVFMDIDRHPQEVVTVYKTSKIEKYWREDL